MSQYQATVLVAQRFNVDARDAGHAKALALEVGRLAGVGNPLPVVYSIEPMQPAPKPEEPTAA